MLVIRLFRTGKKNQPSFKIVVTEKQNPPRGGRFVEQVGSYSPLTKDKVLNKEKIQYWISKGAQPSNTVHNLFVREGILESKKIAVHKKSKKKEEKAEEPKAASLQAEKALEKPEDKVKEETPNAEEKKEEKKEAEKPVEQPKEEPKKEEEPPKEIQ
ncbi:MAG: 30S ribosomal protein S16 [Candidatus Nealsonbacteria bacterium]